jgi:gamma-glutamyl hercynylcysteine S-oxide synthase
MALGRFFRRQTDGGGTAADAAPAAAPRRAASAGDYVPAPPRPVDDDPLRQLWQQERFALIVREEVKWRLHPDGVNIVARAREALDERTALVPEGVVALPVALEDRVGGAETDIPVQPFLLDLCEVTNARFQYFVDADGYDNLDLWPKEIWPHLIELHDLTGHAAPRFWQEGRHDARLADHPVVGVSWYEADAFARWSGQRLPTEAEWQMAASWHLKSEANILRRFPWGDAMDQTRCNVWASRLGATAPADAYPEGAAPNGVRQLIGNVWEWTASAFEIRGPGGRPVLGEMPMRSIRGGAFDTYFESQATSLFRTGQITMGRTHHTGFRCALDLPPA